MRLQDHILLIKGIVVINAFMISVQ